ncbi:MAG: hypothetical protein ACRDN6_08415 [Gaiellaceae bacterium]
MTNDRSTWLLSLPVALAGCLAAHSAAYFLVEPDPHTRAAHGYLAHLPLLAGAGLAVVVGAAVWHALRGRAGARPSPWLFAVLPPLAFALQEHLERLALPLDVVPEPTFLLGLLLQVPFALLARVLAGTLLRAAETVGAMLRQPQRLSRLTAPVPAPVPALRTRSAFSPSRAQRAPPARI